MASGKHAPHNHVLHTTLKCTWIRMEPCTVACHFKLRAHKLLMVRVP